MITLAAALVLIWSRTFIGMANGCGTTELEVLGQCALTVFLTFVCSCSLYVWDDETVLFYKDYEETEDVKISDVSEEYEESDTVDSRSAEWHEDDDCGCEPVHSSGLQISLGVILAVTVICLLSSALPDWTDWLDLFGDSTYMRIGWFRINKKYIYDVLAVIIFPIWTTFIVRKMKESAFSLGAVFSGIMQILTLTLIGFLLYMRRAGIWLIEMALLNVITLILVIRGYAWKHIRKKGNAAALLILYTLFWIALISLLFHNGQSAAGFMGLTDMNQSASYFTNVHKISEHAFFVGQSSILLNDLDVISFMKDSHYLIPSVLFYGGWLPTILLVFVEVIFIVSLAGVLVQAREHDGRDIMLDMIWVGFFIRVAAGLLYAFGAPVPVLLPFSGTAGIITDSICLGMLLMGYLKRKPGMCFNLFEYRDLYEDDSEDWEDDEHEGDKK